MKFLDECFQKVRARTGQTDTQRDKRDRTHYQATCDSAKDIVTDSRKDGLKRA